MYFNKGFPSVGSSPSPRGENLPFSGAIFVFSGSFSRWSNPPVGLPKMMEALQNQNPDWGFRIDIWCFSHEFFVDFPLASISKAALKRNECLEDEMNERLRVQLEENERERKADSWRFSHEKKTIKRGSPTGSFKEKLIKFDGIGQKKPHLLRKTEFHEDGIFAYIYHKDQPKCRCTYIYIIHGIFIHVFWFWLKMNTQIFHTWSIWERILSVVISGRSKSVGIRWLAQKGFPWPFTWRIILGLVFVVNLPMVSCCPLRIGMFPFQMAIHGL